MSRWLTGGGTKADERGHSSPLDRAVWFEHLPVSPPIGELAVGSSNSLRVSSLCLILLERERTGMGAGGGTEGGSNTSRRLGWSGPGPPLDSERRTDNTEHNTERQQGRESDREREAVRERDLHYLTTVSNKSREKSCKERFIQGNYRNTVGLILKGMNYTRYMHTITHTCTRADSEREM